MFAHDLLKAQDRHAALLREHTERRRARQARRSRPRHTLLRSRVLHRVGRWLVAWGSRLQRRYGTLDPIEYRRQGA